MLRRKIDGHVIRYLVFHALKNRYGALGSGGLLPGPVGMRGQVRERTFRRESKAVTRAEIECPRRVGVGRCSSAGPGKRYPHAAASCIVPRDRGSTETKSAGAAQQHRC